MIAIGVGGLEAESDAGRASYMRPDIIGGLELTGRRQPGITATDIVLALTEFLRKEKKSRWCRPTWFFGGRAPPIDARRPRDHLEHDAAFGARSSSISTTRPSTISS